MNNLLKNIGIWLVIGLVVLTVVKQFDSRQTAKDSVAYSDFMVAVTHAAPQAAVPQAVNAWLDTLAPVYTEADRGRFATAYETARDAFGDLRHADGERLIDRALGTASILAAQRLDPDSLTAALLVGLPNVAGYDEARVVAAFGADVATLIGGVARMDVVHVRNG